MKADIVCEGGGVKGIALLGAIYYLEEKGYTFEHFAGTSAGAIVSSLLAVGYTGKDLKNMLLNINFTDFYEKNKLTLLPFIGPTVSLFKNKGLFSGNNIEEYLNNLYKAKGKTKFKDIAKNGESPLKVIASDITNKRLIVLPDDLKDYNIDPMEFNIAKIDIGQLLKQALGENDERFKDSNLNVKLNVPEEKIFINGDGKRLYRVFENLISNIVKYSLSNTRVYIDMYKEEKEVIIVMRNISAYELSFDTNEITNRFKRGDSSRSTEGSGLGLAIAKSIVELHGGSFNIDVDRDLFKSIIRLK